MAVEDTTPTVPVSHVSGAQRFFARATYVFFGKPLLFLLPTFAFIAFGVYSATSKADQYRSVGALSVSNSTLLSSQTDTSKATFGYQGPATTTALEFNELMQTDEFVNQVIDGAGLTGLREAGFLTVGTVRKSVYAVPSGEQLMRIVAVAEQPEAAKSLAKSAITTYKNRVIADQVSGSGVAESFWNDQLDEYKQLLDTANAALQTYLADHPDPITGQRKAVEVQQIATLHDDVTRAQTRFDAALNDREQARLNSVISSADIDQRLRVLDEPTTPSVPDSGLRAMLTTVLIFTALGLMMSLVAVAFATVLERSILSAADLQQLGPPVRAVVPRSKRMRVDSPRRLGVVKTEQDQPPMLSAS